MKQDKSLASRKKSVKTAQFTSLNRKTFIKSFLKDGVNIFWPREMKMVNTLFKIFPNEDFWHGLELSFKLNSLCWFLSDDGRKFLNTEYKKFKLELPEAKKFQLENNNLAFDSNTEYDCKRPLNLKEFLNLWPKKTL